MVDRQSRGILTPMPRLPLVAGQSAPPYRRITDDLRQKIVAGRWSLGAQLPSRRELAEEYAVTPNTINRAIAELMTEGLVGANDRQGTYIAQVAADSAKASTRVTPASLGRGPWRIGVVVALDDGVPAPQVAPDQWTTTILEQLERTLSAGGAVISLYRVYWGRGAVADPQAAIGLAQADRMDAVVILDVHNRPGWDEAAASIDWRTLPAIYVAGVGMQAPFPQLCYDQRHAGYLAARHVADAGYKRLIVLHPTTAPWIEERISGARLGALHGKIAAADFMVHPDPAPLDYVGFRDHNERAAIISRLVDSVVGSWQGSIAVICHADQQALDVIEHLKTLSRMPGRDLGVIGFDDAPGSRAAGLSTVRPPLEQLGEQAGQRVLEALARGCEAVQVCLAPIVIQRDSTRRS